MKRFKEINLEVGMPTSADALTLLKSSIANAKSGNVGCLYVIHGYESSGKGGVSYKGKGQTMASCSREKWDGKNCDKR